MAPKRGTILSLVAAGAVFAGLWSGAPVARASDLPPALTGYQISLSSESDTFAAAAVSDGPIIGGNATTSVTGGGNRGGDGIGGDARAGSSIGGPASGGPANGGPATSGSTTGGSTSARAAGQGQSRTGQAGANGTSATAEIGENIDFGAPGINGLDGAAATGGVGYPGFDANGGDAHGGRATGGNATGGNSHGGNGSNGGAATGKARRSRDGSRRAGERVMTSVSRFVASRLKLRVNAAKSAVDQPSRRKFLGFSFTSGQEPRRRRA